MKRPVHSRRIGFTLIEILVATTLALLLMGAVALMFGRVGESITDSRSMLEAADRLRLAQTRLQMDLAGATATVSPPLKPENSQGYFEYIEGPAIANAAGSSGIAVNTDHGNATDHTVGDFDDILMFTTRTTGDPFVGRINGNTIQSDVAEVAWFLRGRTLHRRVLLVSPSAFDAAAKTNYYTNNDISAYSVGTNTLAPNSLSTLTRRECRYAHVNTNTSSDWTWSISTDTFNRVFPTLPTLNECSASGWLPSVFTRSITNLDLWTNASGYQLQDYAFATGGDRISDDIILTNVIGFDVKAWDPAAPNVAGGYGAYVDLGYGDGTYPLNGLGHYGQTITGTDHTARVYDTWSTTLYNTNWNDGIDNDAMGAPGYGVVDEDDEKGVLPPYPIPLRGIQVKIRVFEPDSMQIREVTVVQDFLPR